MLPNPHNAVGRALDLKTRGCGFDSRAGQPKLIIIFSKDETPGSRLTVLCIHKACNKETWGVLSNFVLCCCTTPCSN